MAAWVAPVVGGALSLGGSLIGGSRAASAAREQAEMQNQAAMRQYEYNLQAWEMDKDKIQADRQYAYQEIAMKARNDGRMADLQDASAAQQYNYQLQIRNREQASNEAQFKRSEEIYAKQMSLNAQSANTATRNEYRKLEEIHTEMTFDRQDAYLESLVAEGKLRARGVTGRSAMKGYQATAADTGRQMAMLNESFSAAGRNTRAVLQEIATDRASADLAAYAQRMLDPGVLPMPLEPLKAFRTEFLYPRAITKADYGPQPVLGAMRSPSAAANQVWGNTITSMAGSLGNTVTGLQGTGFFGTGT